MVQGEWLCHTNSARGIKRPRSNKQSELIKFQLFYNEQLKGGYHVILGNRPKMDFDCNLFFVLLHRVPFLFPGALSANLFPSGVQELLAAIQPNLFDLREPQSGHQQHQQHLHHHHRRRHSLSTNSPSPNFMESCANENSSMRVHTPKHSPSRKSHFENR